ncbi:MAG: class I tRNA ligase family protein, partial [Alphaproteobacteria bacterium]|nr:class I tRNA ligase family protein [Alphaproteobacteria bacterium]
VSSCVREIDRALAAYRFDEAASAAYSFTRNTFCDWYVELAKPLFNGEDAAVTAETRATAAWVLNRILRLLHPFMPFITEELWSQFGDKGQRLINAEWPKLEGLEDKDAADEIGWVIGLISGIRSAKSEMNVPPGSKIPMVLIGAEQANRDRMAAYGELISWLARLDGMEAVDAGTPPPSGSIQIVHREATVALPVGDVIDIAQEKARLEKEIAKEQGEESKVSKKLSNEGFMAKAPQAVVDENRERLAEHQAKVAQLRTALERLSGL